MRSSPVTAAVLFLSSKIISTSSCTGRNAKFTVDEDAPASSGATLEDPLEVAGEGPSGHALERKTNAGELGTERKVVAVKGVPGW